MCLAFHCGRQSGRGPARGMAPPRTRALSILPVWRARTVVSLVVTPGPPTRAPAAASAAGGGRRRQRWQRRPACGWRRDRLLAEQLAGRRTDRGDRVRALVGVRTQHDHRPRPPPVALRWTPGGHRLLGAMPRSYQVTPDIPDRRRATQPTEVRPLGADSHKESQLAARSGPSPRRRTSPTARIQTASHEAVAQRRA